MAQDKKKAVALRYSAGKDNAPVVIAKGKGDLAERIIEIAKREGIPVMEDKQLIEALINIEVYEEIPPVLYEAVARILVFVQEVKKRSFLRPSE